MLIDLVQLRTFVAVAEEQHLTRAAERLHISQSAASAHVRAVEETLDTQLFIRANRSLELTRAGQILLRHAQQLLSEAAQFTSRAREVRGKMEGQVVVGAGSDPLGSRIGEIVSALHAKHPLVGVDLRARPSTSTQQALKSGELDVGMLLGRPIDAGFTYYQLGAVPFRIAGPAAWRERVASADWAQLAELPWIAPSESSMAYSAMLDRLFADRGLAVNAVVRFDSAALGRSLLHSGVGMMLVREEYALQGEKEGLLTISPLAQIDSNLLLTHPTQRSHDPLIAAFVEATRNAWPEMQPLATLSET